MRNWNCHFTHGFIGKAFWFLKIWKDALFFYLSLTIKCTLCFYFCLLHICLTLSHIKINQCSLHRFHRPWSQRHMMKDRVTIEETLELQNGFNWLWFPSKLSKENEHIVTDSFDVTYLKNKNIICVISMTISWKKPNKSNTIFKVILSD